MWAIIVARVRNAIDPLPPWEQICTPCPDDDAERASSHLLYVALPGLTLPIMTRLEHRHVRKRIRQDQVPGSGFDTRNFRQ